MMIATRTATVAAVCLMAAFAMTWSASTKAKDNVRYQNYSSHGPEFFEELLTGRVWVLQRPLARRASDRKFVWAHYHDPNGDIHTCQRVRGRYQAINERWRMAKSDRYRALYNQYKVGKKPDPAEKKRHRPIFYNPQTGMVHDEFWDRKTMAWYHAAVGWVQDSWPRVLKDACPKLALPADLPINEKQTAKRFDKLMVQDPDAPLRGLMGSEPPTPGGTGMGAADGGPTFPAAALKQFLIENDGRVLVDFTGPRFVLVLNPERDELWRLNADGAIEDIGYLVASGDGKKLNLQYEHLPEKRTYFLGFALPFLATGERYAAMQMMDWVVGRGEDVVLPFLERERVAFGFAEGGQLVARTTDGEDVPGTWWWSRGRLHVNLEGIDRTNAYPWDELAAHVGWTLSQ